MPNNSKNQINIDNNINKVPFDNIAKQNLATYIIYFTNSDKFHFIRKTK